MESKVFEEFMDIDITFQNEDAPSIGAWMTLD
jgi:hypothetical protein